jgi:hypothetical protein
MEARIPAVRAGKSSPAEIVVGGVFKPAAPHSKSSGAVVVVFAVCTAARPSIGSSEIRTGLVATVVFFTATEVVVGVGECLRLCASALFSLCRLWASGHGLESLR